MVVFDHHLKKYSNNPIQIQCVHLLGQCSELIRFWDTLAKLWPSSGRKTTENDGFRPSSENVFTQSNSNLVCILIVKMLRKDSFFGHVGQILALFLPQDDCKWWFPWTFRFWRTYNIVDIEQVTLRS